MSTFNKFKNVAQLGALTCLVFTKTFSQGFYIGGSLNVNQDSYSKKQENTGGAFFATSAFQSYIRATISNVNFVGTESSMQALINSKIPLTDYDLGLTNLFEIDNAGNMTTINCVNTNGIPIGSHDTCEADGFITTTVTPSGIQQSIGKAFFQFMQSYMPQIEISFTSVANQEQFQTTLGINILTAIMTPGTDPNNLNDITDAFNPAGSGNALNDSIFALAMNTFGNVIVKDPITLAEFTTIQNAIFQTLKDNANITYIEGGGGGLTPVQIEEVSTLKDSASKININASILAGYLYNITKNLAAGVEGSLDFGSNSFGAGKENEINVKYNLSISILGKIGYLSSKQYFTYLNLGLAFREYAIKYEGNTLSFSNNVLKQHALIGLGFEVPYNKNFNIFTELNHIFTTTKANVGINGIDLNIKTEQLKIGAKYYFTDAQNRNYFPKNHPVTTEKDYEKIIKTENEDNKMNQNEKEVIKYIYIEKKTSENKNPQKVSVNGSECSAEALKDLADNDPELLHCNKIKGFKFKK